MLDDLLLLVVFDELLWDDGVVFGQVVCEVGLDCVVLVDVLVLGLLGLCGVVECFGDGGFCLVGELVFEFVDDGLDDLLCCFFCCFGYYLVQ